MMKAEHSGRGLAGTLDVLKRLREHWLLAVALVSALFWARDLAAIHLRLPADVSRQAEAVSALTVRITELETRIGAVAVAGGPSGSQPPGTLSGMLSGRAGRWTALRWHSPAALDPACIARDAEAVLVDATGGWHRLELRLGPGGEAPSAGLALGVRPRHAMGSGLARLRIGVTHRCRGREREESSPWTPFVLLDP